VPVPVPVQVPGPVQHVPVPVPVPAAAAPAPRVPAPSAPAPWVPAPAAPVVPAPVAPAPVAPAPRPAAPPAPVAPATSFRALVNIAHAGSTWRYYVPALPFNGGGPFQITVEKWSSDGSRRLGGPWVSSFPSYRPEGSWDSNRALWVRAVRGERPVVLQHPGTNGSVGMPLTAPSGVCA